MADEWQLVNMQPGVGVQSDSYSYAPMSLLPSMLLALKSPIRWITFRTKSYTGNSDGSYRSCQIVYVNSGGTSICHIPTKKEVTGG